jgi:4-hydroxy-tetrahydrodipicolinate reductase
VKLAIAGAGGRMGRALLDACGAFEGLQVAAALEHPSSPLIGRDAAELLPAARGITITADFVAALAGVNTLIDFTRPEGTLAHLAVCRKHGVSAVIGTTGFTPAQRQEIDAAAREIAIVFAPNMSIGVNVTLKLIEMATRALHAQYDIEIIEAHHKLKVDAPSGTALKMGEVAAAAMGKSLDDIGVFSRHGVTGERKPGTIGFTAIRGGDIIGDHAVMYAGTGERIEISHKSSSRTNYAQGAMRAAQFLQGRKAGLFDMQDVLGLRDQSRAQ